MGSSELPVQEYRCDNDGPFDIHLTFAEDVASSTPCPECGVPSRHVLRAPAAKFARTWNEQANDDQRNPYTQAKAQSWNNYNEKRDMGVWLDKPTEESIQVGARAIDESERNPKPPAHIQQMQHARKLKKKKQAA